MSRENFCSLSAFDLSVKNREGKEAVGTSITWRRRVGVSKTDNTETVMIFSRSTLSGKKRNNNYIAHATNAEQYSTNKLSYRTIIFLIISRYRRSISEK